MPARLQARWSSLPTDTFSLAKLIERRARLSVLHVGVLHVSVRRPASPAQAGVVPVAPLHPRRPGIAAAETDTAPRLVPDASLEIAQSRGVASINSRGNPPPENAGRVGEAWRLFSGFCLAPASSPGALAQLSRGGEPSCPTLLLSPAAFASTHALFVSRPTVWSWLLCPPSRGRLKREGTLDSFDLASPGGFNGQAAFKQSKGGATDIVEEVLWPFRSLLVKSMS